MISNLETIAHSGHIYKNLLKYCGRNTTLTFKTYATEYKRSNDLLCNLSNSNSTGILFNHRKRNYSSNMNC